MLRFKKLAMRSLTDVPCRKNYKIKMFGIGTRVKAAATMAAMKLFFLFIFPFLTCLHF